eukprot:scaffold2926_cov247-Pinguiococcus_pyrenoidosus.AAC.9
MRRQRRPPRRSLQRRKRRKRKPVIKNSKVCAECGSCAARQPRNLSLTFLLGVPPETVLAAKMVVFMAKVHNVAQASINVYVDGTVEHLVGELSRVAQAEALAAMADVSAAMGCLRVVQWCVYCLRQLVRRPSIRVLRSIVSRGSVLPLPNPKPLRYLESLLKRCVAWREQYERVIQGPRYSPLNGAASRMAHPGRSADEKPVDLARLEALTKERVGIPVSGRDVEKCQAALEDEGKRWCLCGRPNDGAFMIGCDSCEEWFHGPCVGVPAGKKKRRNNNNNNNNNNNTKRASQQIRGLLPKASGV